MAPTIRSQNSVHRIDGMAIRSTSAPSGLKMREWEPNLGLKPEAVSLRLVETENDDLPSVKREKDAYQQQAPRPSKFDLENAA